MHVKILTPPVRMIDSISADHFRVGEVYNVTSSAARVAVAEGWAEIVADTSDEIMPITPLLRDRTNRRHRVLVVDDDPDVRHLIGALLSAHGYQVAIACNGTDAMRQAREACPDLIVLDLNMPVMDGWRFRTAQRYFGEKQLAEVPVLLMTAEDNAATHADALLAVGVIDKPIDFDKFLHAVSVAIAACATEGHTD